MKKQTPAGMMVPLVKCSCFALLAALAASRCGAGTVTFANTESITINDPFPPGIARATPYPSTLTVSGFPASGTIEKVTVTLHSLTHGTPDDLDILLVGPGGQNLIILSDGGGGFAEPGIPVTLTLDDEAASGVPDDGPDEGSLASGTYRPGNFESGADVFPAPAPPPSTATTLAVFAGSSPNGDWQLYIMDDDAQDSGFVADGWSLTIVSADLPPPAASVFTALHHFTAGSGPMYANSDGVSPEAGLILSGDVLYGTAMRGGNWGNGTVFRVNTDGTEFTTLHSFSAASGSFPDYSNSDGAYPASSLALSDNTLYGTAVEGGSSGYGTVFKINTDGSGFTTLHSFTAAPEPSYTNIDGARPHGGVILAGNTLYGTAAGGGDAGGGTVFKVNTDGTNFAILHSFSAQSYPLYSNSDGANPYGGLVLSGSILYGTAVGGGSANKGTLFAVNTDGTGFRALHDFTGGGGGASPRAGLVLSGSTLLGTTLGGTGWGTVFAVCTDGTGFTILHDFTGSGDGGSPRGLIVSGSTVYGTTSNGGTSGRGTLFQVRTDGMGFTTLHNFTAQSPSEPYPNGDGAEPMAGLILSGNMLYGTASQGGSAGSGTLFSLALPPPSYAVWAASFGLSGAAAAADADPDSDRLANAVEYILGGNPAIDAAAASSGHPAATLSGDNLLFTFSRDDASETPDVTLTVESGTDLVTWPGLFTIGPDSASSSPGVSISENGTDPDTISVAVPAGTGETEFARLKVTVTP